MAAGGVEVERKYELEPPDAPLPDLTAADGVARVELLPEELLEARYFDTADLRLARSRATLRRRTGGRDAGWHLKLPGPGEGRYEIAEPLRRGGTSVPKPLRLLVLSRTRGASLGPVARLHTSRRVQRLLDDDGRVLAEVADDKVTAEQLGGQVVVRTWREVEVELVDGSDAVLNDVERVLLVAGARRSPSPSKLAQALGDRLPAPPEVGRRAGDALLAYLREQVAELVSHDPLVRRDEPDAVHRMRVATRRLRSALRTFRPLLDRTATDPLRAELKHLAGVLGAARDAEVLRERLLAMVAEQPADLVLGPVARRVADELGGRYRSAHAVVVAELDGGRYLWLLDALEELVAGPPQTGPPLTGRAARPAGPELRRRVRRVWRELAIAHDAAAGSGDRAELLHEVRKAAKQARYAGELATAAVGKPARRFAVAAEQVQEALGEHQDSVVAKDALRALAVAAQAAGESSFTLGRLHGLQELRAHVARDRYGPAWQRLSSPKVVGWLR